MPYSDEQVAELVRKLCRDDACMNFIDEADVGLDPMFPEDEAVLTKDTTLHGCRLDKYQ